MIFGFASGLIIFIFQASQYSVHSLLTRLRQKMGKAVSPFPTKRKLESNGFLARNQLTVINTGETFAISGKKFQLAQAKHLKN